MGSLAQYGESSCCSGSAFGGAREGATRGVPHQSLSCRRIFSITPACSIIAMTLIRFWQCGHCSGSVCHTFRITSLHFLDGSFAGGGWGGRRTQRFGCDSSVCSHITLPAHLVGVPPVIPDHLRTFIRNVLGELFQESPIFWGNGFAPVNIEAGLRDAPFPPRKLPGDRSSDSVERRCRGI